MIFIDSVTNADSSAHVFMNTNIQSKHGVKYINIRLTLRSNSSNGQNVNEEWHRIHNLRNATILREHIFTHCMFTP